MGLVQSQGDVAARLPGRNRAVWRQLVDALPALAPGGSTDPGSGSGRPLDILDCGGGSGSLAVPLAEAGARVTVVDISVDALATLRRRAAEAGVADRVVAVQGDIESIADLPLGDGFDLALVHDVLAAVDQPARALRDVAAGVRAGGLLSVVVANPVAEVLSRVLAGDVVGALHELHAPAPSGLSRDELLALLPELGIEIANLLGLGVFTELLPGGDSDRAALDELEAAAAVRLPYRDIASRLHVIGRRPVTADPE